MTSLDTFAPSAEQIRLYRSMLAANAYSNAMTYSSNQALFVDASRSYDAAVAAFHASLPENARRSSSHPIQMAIHRAAK